VTAQLQLLLLLLHSKGHRQGVHVDLLELMRTLWSRKCNCACPKRPVWIPTSEPDALPQKRGLPVTPVTSSAGQACTQLYMLRPTCWPLPNAHAQRMSMLLSVINIHQMISYLTDVFALLLRMTGTVCGELQQHTAASAPFSACRKACQGKCAWLARAAVICSHPACPMQPFTNLNACIHT
jgi:hypothetical protein